jgi:predicted NBD/HSP70 family sugar kinase
MDRKRYIVLDVGGTNVRAASYDPTGDCVHDVCRYEVINMYSQPGADVHFIQEALLDQLRGAIERTLALCDCTVPAIAIAFGGPITADGVVSTAPTIWGRQDAPLALGARLSAALSLPVHVINDVSAAAWRYADTVDQPFCLITISSGIGNKVFYDGKVLVNRGGFGGEIGHTKVDFSQDAPVCDCGARGHLGAVASGRGVVAVAKRLARTDPARFAASKLAKLCDGCVENVTSRQIVAADGGGDPFAHECVRIGVRHLANVIAGIYGSIGIELYIFMGGFAQALGRRYLGYVEDELRRIGLFGREPGAISGLLRMAEPDDDHGLIGGGRYLHHLLQGTRTGPPCFNAGTQL